MNGPPSDGFKKLSLSKGFAAHNGPYYFGGTQDDGVCIYGFQSEEKHGNPNGVVHGGALITFLDTICGHALIHQTRRYCATVSLNTHFISGVKTGGWIEGRVTIKRAGRALAFMESDAVVDGDVVVSVSSVWRLLDPITPENA